MAWLTKHRKPRRKTPRGPSRLKSYKLTTFIHAKLLLRYALPITVEAIELESSAVNPPLSST